MKKKMITVFALAATSALACGILSACGEEAYVFPPFEYDYTEPVEDFGDGIQIDGKLTEEVWKDQRFLREEIRNTPAKYNMTSYYGEKGVYFAFEVEDNAVYYNPEREIWANSGVEFCVGSLDNTNITYEIDLTVGGVTQLRKYTGQPYTNWFKDLHSAVYTDGEINAPDCKGYSVELYLPYTLFAAEGETVDCLLVNPGIVRAESASAYDTNRLWYSIGEAERGLGWAPASLNWYRFDADGLQAKDVTIEESEGGKISGKNYFFQNEAYEFAIQADEGYRLDTLKVNGLDVSLNDLYYRNGIAHYSLFSLWDISVSATFVPVSEDTRELSGVVSLDGNPTVSGVTLYAVSGGMTQMIPVGEDGNYSVLLPKAEYTLVCEASGYMTKRVSVILEENAEQDIRLIKPYLGTSEVIGAGSNPESWDFSDLGDGTVRSMDNGWLVAANHTTMYEARVFVSANIKLPMQSGTDRRAGFRFVDENGNGIYVCLLAENERGQNRYSVQFIGLDGNGGTSWPGGVELTGVEGVASLAAGEGVPFAVLYDGAVLSVWVNGVKVMQDWVLQTHGITGLFEWTPVVPGLVTCGGGEFCELVFSTQGYADTACPVTVKTQGSGTAVCDKQTYTLWDELKITATPEEGYKVGEITVNGVDYTAKMIENVLSVRMSAIYADIVVTFVPVS